MVPVCITLAAIDVMAAEDTSIRSAAMTPGSIERRFRRSHDDFRLEAAPGAVIDGRSACRRRDDKTVISKRPSVARRRSARRVLCPSILGSTLVGKRLEHYDLNEFVGGGGMGAVFRATDTRLGRTVAVKVLSRDHTDEETIRRFRNEAQSAARLDHPNIARVYYVGEDHGWNFIVFEFIEGIEPPRRRRARRPARRSRRRCTTRCRSPRPWPTRPAATWCIATSSPRTCW